MSSSDSLVTIALDEPTAELRILNGDFHTVARGLGSSTLTLAPGVYKARALAGGDSVESLFTVNGSGAPVSVALPSIRFSSALPLERTSTSREYHQQAFSEASRSPARDIGFGAGSSLLICVRDPSSACFTQQGAASENKARYYRSFLGFTLQRVGDDRKVALETVAIVRCDLGYLVAHLEVAPGCYILSYSADARPPIAMPVVASRERECQLFFQLDVPADLSAVGRANVRERGLVLVPTGRPFDPQDPALRTTEVARRAYSLRRFALARGLLEEVVRDLDSSPMAGIFACHLALQDPDEARNSDNRALLRMALHVLASRLGDGFADVVALQLAVGASHQRRIEQWPLLRASWQLLQWRASEVQISDALEALLARSINVGTWLCWRPRAEGIDAARPPSSFRFLEGQARDLNAEVGSRLKSASPEQNHPHSLLARIADHAHLKRAIEWLEANAQSSLALSVTGLQATLLAWLKCRPGADANAADVTDDDLAHLSESLRVSPRVLETSLEELEQLLALVIQARDQVNTLNA